MIYRDWIKEEKENFEREKTKLFTEGIKREMVKHIDENLYDFNDLIIFIAKNGQYTELDKTYFLGILKGMENNLAKGESDLIRDILK